MGAPLTVEALLEQLDANSTTAPPPPYSPPRASIPATSSAAIELPGFGTKTMTGHSPPAKTPVTITLDNSTHISGDNNKVCLPGISASASAESTKLATMLALALRHVQGADGRTVNINVKGGLSIYGNRNVVVTNGMVPGFGRPVAVKTEVGESLKRKAEEGPDEEPPTKRVEAV